MQPHPNVVAALGCAAHGDRVYLVMEWCALGSLDHYLRSVSRPLSEKLKILLDAARGIAHLHAVGVIHRDIAARNVLIGHGGIGVRF
jgi:eukaryotic-like serine/threonine-protein kinase